MMKERSTSDAKLSAMIPNHLWGVRGGMAIARALRRIASAINALRRLIRLRPRPNVRKMQRFSDSVASTRLNWQRRLFQNSQSE
jgi:hypothetical protein